MIYKIVALTGLVALLRVPTSAVPAVAAASPAHGEEVFRACVGCHSERPDATGPTLRGVVGRTVASVEGFRYSSAMKRASFVWTTDTLRAYLRDPQAVVKGNRMPFPGLPNEADVANVVAYLAQLK
jgi:cytochrome c2